MEAKRHPFLDLNAQIVLELAALSGGENIRIKLLKLRNSKADILGIDKPFKVLSLTEIFSVVSFLLEMIKKEKTIIVIDHNEEAFQFFAKHIELISDKGILKGLLL